MQEDTGKVRMRHCGIQCLDAQGVNILQLSFEKRIQLRLRNDVFRHKEVADTFQAMPVAAQTAAHTSGLPPRSGERSACFGLLGGIKNARAHIDDAKGLVLSVQSNDSPTYGCDADVKADRVWIHSMSSSNAG